VIFMSDSWETTTTSKEAWSRIVIIIWMAWGFPFWQCFWIRRHYVVMLRCGGIIVLTWCNGGGGDVVVATCSSRSSCGVFVARFATSFSGLLLGRSSHSFLRCMCSSRSLLGSVHCVHLAKSSCCFVAMLSCCFVATSLCSFCCDVVVARSASFLFL